MVSITLEELSAWWNGLDPEEQERECWEFRGTLIRAVTVEIQGAQAGPVDVRGFAIGAPQAYWMTGLPQAGPIDIHGLADIFVLLPRQSAAPLERPGPQRGRKLPCISDAFVDGRGIIWSALPFQAYPQAASNAASGATRWMEEQMGEHAFRASYTFRKKSGTTTIALISPADEVNAQAARESIWRQVRGMSDLDGDVYLALIRQLVASRGTRDKDGWTWITAAQILDYRGIQPRKERTESGKEYRAGHRQEDLEDIWRCIRRMYNARITVNQAIFEEPRPGRKGATKQVRYTRESPLFQWSQVLTRQELWPEQDGMVAPKMEVAWQVKESPWMDPFIQGTNQMTGELLQSCLQYDPHNEKWEKRISQYLMFHLTMNRQRAKITRPLGAMLEELSLSQEIDERNPVRTKDRFEKALNRLRQDGHISRWRYKKEIELPARKWMGTWLTQEITFERLVVVDALPDQQ